MFGYNETMEVGGKRVAEELFHAAIRAVDPYASVAVHMDKVRAAYLEGGFRRLLVVGFGKASCRMATAAEDRLGDIINAGVIVTKNGHVSPERPRSLEIYEAGHPVPDESGLRATERIISLLEGLDKNTMVLCLISGGGSALLVSPASGISLRDKQNTTDMLLKSGADINELNSVRKHISRVKGGRLAGLAYPAKVVSLIISDVVGDRLDVIASGPTAPDFSAYAGAFWVLEKYSLLDKVPRSVVDVLTKGMEGKIPETPKEGNRVFDNVVNIVVASNRAALEATAKEAEGLGFRAEVLSAGITGEAREVGRRLAENAKERLRGGARRLCLISGGETTVTVKGRGKGGRNMELALSFAMEIAGTKGVTLISAGTDGTDGPTDAAGAIVDGDTVKGAMAAGLDPERYLNENDSYNFFRLAGGLFFTGPTGTNVMDVQAIVID